MSTETKLEAALRDAIEGMEDMLPYVSEYFREKWGHQGYIDRAKAALAEAQGPRAGAARECWVLFGGQGRSIPSEVRSKESEEIYTDPGYEWIRMVEAAPSAPSSGHGEPASGEPSPNPSPEISYCPKCTTFHAGSCWYPPEALGRAPAPGPTDKEPDRG